MCVQDLAYLAPFTVGHHTNVDCYYYKFIIIYIFVVVFVHLLLLLFEGEGIVVFFFVFFFGGGGLHPVNQLERSYLCHCDCNILTVYSLDFIKLFILIKRVKLYSI